MRMKRKWLRPLAAVAVVALVAASCGGDDDDDDSTDTTAAGATTTEPVDVPEGGTLVIGAEQEPDCVAWILTCSGSSWGYWMMGVTTMPRAYDTVKEGDTWVAVPNPLLTGEATVDETDPEKPVVTYSLNPEAVWSDGTAISCDDFVFTWDAIANGEDIYDPTGYTDIEGIDCPDAQTVVVSYARPYAGWKGLFGAGYGIFPAHILEGKSISDEMANGYEWSGGAWMIEKWEKGVEVVLVPNENWWGDAPKLDEVIFKIQADTAAEFQAFKNNEVSMIYPQPQLDVVDQIQGGIEGAQTQFSADTGNLEALWMNNAAAPLDDPNVRKAVAYALDRDAIVGRLFGDLGIDTAMQTLNPPILAGFSDPEAWSMYTLDLDMVDELLTESGYAKGDDGYYAKDGERLSLELKSTAGNARRELTGQVLQEQLKAAGIEMVLNYQEAGALFGEQLPAGDYQFALYAQVLTFISPGQCLLFCSKNIPSEENEMSGQNWQRVGIPELDPILEELDMTVDAEAAAELGRQADAIEAEAQISLPLDPLPNILIWSDMIVGPVADNPVLGPFSNMEQWGLAS